MVCHEPCFKVTIAEALTAVWCLVLVPVYSALAYFCRKVLENDYKTYQQLLDIPICRRLLLGWECMLVKRFKFSLPQNCSASWVRSTTWGAGRTAEGSLSLYSLSNVPSESWRWGTWAEHFFFEVTLEMREFIDYEESSQAWPWFRMNAGKLWFCGFLCALWDFVM